MREIREFKMKHRIILRLAVVLLAMLGFAFAEISGYTEKLMPVIENGVGVYNYIVIGDSVTVTSTPQANLTINNISYGKTNNEIVPAPDDGSKRYYIEYNANNSNASMTINGNNDWTTQDTSNISIGLPFSQNGSGSYFYVTTVEIDSLASANIDFLLINNEDYTNQSIGTIPERIDGNYYIYYGATNTNAQLNLYWVPLLNVKVFLEGGL
jgi:hypothetical protein